MMTESQPWKQAVDTITMSMSAVSMSAVSMSTVSMSAEITRITEIWCFLIIKGPIVSIRGSETITFAVSG